MKRKLLLVHANSHGEEKDANWVSLYYEIYSQRDRYLYVFHFHLEIYTRMAIFLYSSSGYMSILQSVVVIVTVVVAAVVIVIVVVFAVVVQ